MCGLEVLCGIAAILLAGYYYFTSTFNFWKSRGVIGPKPTPFFGNSKDVMFLKKSIGDLTTQIYNEYKSEPTAGIFLTREPILILNDPEIIKDVLISDFSTFADRGIFIPEKMEPLSLHLFNLEPERWRPLRMKLSPVFTSGKLKGMFSLILECSNRLEDYLEKLIQKGEPVECREFTAKFTTDVIGSCAFGIETNALSDENSEFRRMGRQIFSPDFINVMRRKARTFVPRLYHLLGYVAPQPVYHQFYTKVVKDTIEYRTKNNIVRHDFIDTLMNLRKNQHQLDGVELTDNLLAAQAFVFFAAGFETSSTTISNALYELALNQDTQEKLREEITKAYAECEGDLTYEHIKKMPYLHKVFQETLRKYPPVPLLERKAMTNYTFKRTKVSIPKDTPVWIPVFGIHRDPDIYPNPDKFDPERFDADAIVARHQMHYLPFGDGPRNCIGARFGVYQTKIGIVKILRKYKVDVCEKTQIPYVINPASFLLAPVGGIHLQISKVKNC